MSSETATATVKVLSAIELNQPVMLTERWAFTLAPGLMADSPHAGAVAIRLGGVVHTLDTVTALRLLRDLRNAVETSAGWPPV